MTESIPSIKLIGYLYFKSNNTLKVKGKKGETL